MSFVESPAETVSKFIPLWRTSHPARLSEEIISVFNETNRVPDPFRLIYQEGTILNYETREPVKIDRSTYIGQKEGEFFDTLVHWLGENDKGTAVWISPLLKGAYPCNKITIYQIKEGASKEKITLNTSVLLDTPPSHCLTIASKLNSSFNLETNPEVLRNKLFSLNNDFGLANLLEIASIKVNFTSTPGQETINEFMDLIYSGYEPRFITEAMRQKRVLGDHSISCASLNTTPNQTFGVFMDKHSLVLKFTGSESGKYVKNCGNCGTRIEAKISKGYKCSMCGGVFEGC